jgi:ADP-heptose:LPS heptosyltransferase
VTDRRVPGATYRFLIIQIRPIGDVFISSANVGLLKEHFPGCTVTYLTGKNFAGVLRAHPQVDDIITCWSGGGILHYASLCALVPRIRSRRFTHVIDSQNATTSRIIALLSNAPHKIGFSGRSFDKALTHRANRSSPGPAYGAYQVTHLLRPLNIAPKRIHMHYSIPSESRNWAADFLNSQKISRFVVIAPGAKTKHKRWPLDKYISLTRRIRDGCAVSVVAVYAPYERPCAEALCDAVRTGVFLPDNPTLNQSMALIARSCLLVCNDCGLNHLSVTLPIPVIAIFGRTSVARWSPASMFPSHYHMQKPATERAGDGFGISAEEVFCKVTEVVRQAPPRCDSPGVWTAPGAAAHAAHAAH